MVVWGELRSAAHHGRDAAAETCWVMADQWNRVRYMFLPRRRPWNCSSEVSGLDRLSLGVTSVVEYFAALFRGVALP